jgi:hypothetical protein
MIHKNRVSDKKNGFLMTELICATALVLVSLTLIIKWHAVLAQHRTDALKKIDMVTRTVSLLDQLSIDDRLRSQGNLNTNGYNYTWKIESISFEKADHIFGPSGKKSFFSFIVLKVEWINAKAIKKELYFKRPLA